MQPLLLTLFTFKGWMLTRREEWVVVLVHVLDVVQQRLPYDDSQLWVSCPRCHIVHVVDDGMAPQQHILAACFLAKCPELLAQSYKYFQ